MKQHQHLLFCFRENKDSDWKMEIDVFGDLIETLMNPLKLPAVPPPRPRVPRYLMLHTYSIINRWLIS